MIPALLKQACLQNLLFDLGICHTYVESSPLARGFRSSPAQGEQAVFARKTFCKKLTFAMSRLHLASYYHFPSSFFIGWLTHLEFERITRKKNDWTKDHGMN
jgi:hypothetical protein